MKVVLQELTKKFPNRSKKSNDVVAVDNCSFEIPDGSLVGLLGPSGCGKSTTLNMICGLQKPTSGKIYFENDDVTDLPPEKRGVGFVFQNYALYPHLTVKQNIMFPLENLKRKEKLSKEEMSEKATQIAKLVQIDELLDRKPGELSGGQQQRVSIARALAGNPPVILADEPTGALDSKTGKEVIEFLKKLNSEGTTIVLITHDNDIASRIKRVVRIYDGKIISDETKEGEA